MFFDERDMNMDYISEVNDIDIKEKNNINEYNIDTINIMNFRKEDSLYSDKEALDKGNSFISLYKPYKNNIFKIVVSGERDNLLLRIQELTFKLIDLGLYLDQNSDDIALYEEYRRVVEDLNKHKEIYEKKYGPLCKESTLYYEEYRWNKDPWPWMKEGGR